MKTALLLSGGVDSSVALFRLRELGRDDITAFYLKIWLEDELAHMGRCPWEEDLDVARAVCERAAVPLQVVPLQREYYERVVEYVVRELRIGNTPSPDIFCNQRIKFGAFLDAVGSGFDKVATGHYAITEERGGAVVLKRGVDRVKDQTYFLSHLSQTQVARALFPIGELPKARVRQIARDLGLPNESREESQGICFLGKVKYPEFVRHYLGERAGPIVEKETGKVLGQHRGYWFHTIGQRQGLGLGGGPWYVVKKEIESNVVYVTQKAHIEAASRRSFEVTRIHWIAGAPVAHAPLCGPPAGGAPVAMAPVPLRLGTEHRLGTEFRHGTELRLGTKLRHGTELRLGTKLRHGPEVRPCTIGPLGDGPPEEDRLRVELDAPDPGVAPGQFAVFYDGEICLGGGMIAT